MSLISLEKVDLGHGGAAVLRAVDLEIAPREILTVIGPNGSGKSTLLQGITGALSPMAGKVRRLPGLKLGYVPQKLAIDPTLPLTVARFLKLGRQGARAAEIAEHIGISALMDRQMAALSGGQFQRVLLAKAAQSAPQLILLDEPTQGLDQPGTAAFYQLIAELRDALGAAIVMVSHDLHVVMSASDRVICLNGHICCQGTPSVVSAAPEYRALFGAGTKGALALYQHAHDHNHHHDHS